MMSTTDEGFDCDWCGRYFGPHVTKRIADGLVLCPICYKKNFVVETKKRWYA